jgi:hypothetical protein
MACDGRTGALLHGEAMGSARYEKTPAEGNSMVQVRFPPDSSLAAAPNADEYQPPQPQKIRPPARGVSEPMNVVCGSVAGFV